MTHGPNDPHLDIRHLRPGIALEAEAGLLEQFGGHAEIALRILQSPMAKVDRQVGQEPLDVFAFAIPGDKPDDSEGVPEKL